MFDPVDLLVPQPIKLVVLLIALAVYTHLSRRMHAPRLLRILLALLAVWAWVFSTPGYPNYMMAMLEGTPQSSDMQSKNIGQSPLIVVLPSGQLFTRSGQPNPRLDEHGWERLQTGMHLWKEIGGTLLLAGGPGDNIEQSMSGRMLAIALELGVPRGSIVMTFRSRTTYEDILQASEQIKRHQGPVWLVTSALHMPRAMAVGRQLGLNMQPYPCDYRQIQDPTWRIWFPDNGGPSLWLTVLHELIGYQYYRLRNWAD